MLTGTRNDQAKATNITLETREDRNLAMVAYDFRLEEESSGFALGRADPKRS